MNHWLVKTEPDVYSWDHLVAEKVGRWDGVRNLVARNNLRAMQLNDLVFVYHTGKAKEIVGVATVKRVAYPDPTDSRPIWSAVDLAPVCKLTRPVSLKEVKANPEFAQCLLVRTSRLSVMPISAEHFTALLKAAETTLPKEHRSAP
jgi:predicted RNA-binding protein with PUA-like domain